MHAGMYVWLVAGVSELGGGARAVYDRLTGIKRKWGCGGGGGRRGRSGSC